MEAVFGTEHHVTVLQQCARGTLVFSYGFLILRLSGRRIFAKWSPLDIIVSVIVGSALARVITGDATIDGTFAAVAVMVALHLGLSWLLSHSEKLALIIEGGTVVLAANGVIDEKIRKAHLISKADMCEGVGRVNLV